ncbi:hypothetical protein B0H13DRAFT_1636894 [Mycena leptocephala]|nr:hypothetical protein B0H13DRAFT_1636894 [Mycena leptocephala]
MHKWRGKKFKSFRVFDDNTSEGFHGFISSSQWLRDLFDKFIGLHGPDFDQAMSLFPALINAIDHSFKACLAKHITKVNGEQVFIAPLTVTNENGEIRVCNLVSTKSHSQFELALHRMRHSLYEHGQPAVFYTDNMSDKDFLEYVFDSLCDAVVTVEKHGHLDALKFPSNFRVQVMDNR